MKRSTSIAVLTFLVCAAALAGLLGCDEDLFVGSTAANQPPSIRLTGGPPEGDTTSYRIEFSWMGYDPDGHVEHYEYAMCDGDPVGFDPADTTGADKWSKITRTDSTFSFSADQDEGTTITVGANKYSTFCTRVHTFFVRAVDNRGARSAAAYRSFTARTLSPYVVIVQPKNAFAGREQQLSGVVKFGWTGEDPIDQVWKIERPESTRYLLATYTSYVLNDLNKTPAKFEDLWSPWKSYTADGDSGVATVIGDDEILVQGYSYVFAVQAKDEAGAVTSVFDLAQNARLFRISKPPGPFLRVREPNLGGFAFIGTNNRTQTFRVPADFGMVFSWEADASSYGGVVSTYRYGWDIADLNDPSEWDVEPSPFVLSTPVRKYHAGVHTLYIEAADNLGATTLASLEVTVFPQRMTRNLLWVDDFYSTDFLQKDYSFPTEHEHDEFWTNICRRAKDFNPDIDIYDTWYEGNTAPDIEVLYRYKNIIWSYSSSSDIMAWDDMVRYVPETSVGQAGVVRFSFLGYYLVSGGHIWSEGKSDQYGGLGAVLPILSQTYPRNFRCEINATSQGCQDTSGASSIGYRLYCVTVIDKVRGGWRNDPRMPDRSPDYDALMYALKDTHEPRTLAHPELPDTLRLWERVTRDGMYFDPKVRGLSFVEIYNPAYWMRIVGAQKQDCFCPMYRIKTRYTTLSPINGDVVAFWATRYANVEADAPGAVPAPCVQFGLPLWYFDRDQVNAIADAIFREWNISVFQ
jgi:hypothetical protein